MIRQFAPAWDPLPELVPVRMLNEFIYCPRLAYLEWVQGEFADSADTVEGTLTHRRVDNPPQKDRAVDWSDAPPGDRAGKTDATPQANGTATAASSAPASPPRPGGKPQTIRDLMMSAPNLGLIAVMDMVDFTGRYAVPIDYKRGYKAPVEGGVYDPERVQLCAQGMILEENGYRVDHGVTYFAQNRRRVEVPFDDELRRLTLESLARLRQTAEQGIVPAPLEDSPKCQGCSLVGICLPDEVDFLADRDKGEATTEAPRMILPSPDEALPVYVQTQGLYIGKHYGVLQIKEKGKVLKDVPMHDVSSLALFGNVQITTQAMQALIGRGIPICFFSMGGWFYGVAHGLGHKNIQLRHAQFTASGDPATRVMIARRLVADKIRNCRTMLRRNGAGVSQEDLRRLAGAARDAEAADNPDSLLGIEGTAARIYFQNFMRMIKRNPGTRGFSMENRNRRPPRDPVNALLSFAYALLAKTCTVAGMAAGFDAYLGFYHGAKYGRPALALDMMETFRPIIADSTVVTAINQEMVKPGDFVTRVGAVSLKDKAKGAFVRAFETRLGHTVTHPVFGYKITYRQVLEVQARLLGRFLLGELREPPGFVVR